MNPLWSGAVYWQEEELSDRFYLQSGLSTWLKRWSEEETRKYTWSNIDIRERSGGNKTENEMNA